ncbi:MAG TPA: hypothetical protein VF154_13020, partial [Terriglobales bacterium]
TRDIAAITYGANPEKKGLDRVLAAWRRESRPDEELVVAGLDAAAGARWLPPGFRESRKPSTLAPWAVECGKPPMPAASGSRFLMPPPLPRWERWRLRLPIPA